MYVLVIYMQETAVSFCPPLLPTFNYHHMFLITFVQVWNSFINTVIDTLHASGPSITRNNVNAEPPPAVLPAAERLVAIG